MLHEYRNLIAELRQNDNYFARLFSEHNELDEEINRLASNPTTAATSHDQIEQKKREKLALKDKIYQYLRQVEEERKNS